MSTTLTPTAAVAAETLPPETRKTPPTANGGWDFECRFTQLLLESSTQERMFGCGGAMPSHARQSRTEAQYLEVVLSWSQQSSPAFQQLLNPDNKGDAPDAVTDARNFMVTDALRIRMAEQKTAVAIATRLHESRHPEEKENARSPIWGYPPPDASGMAKAVWSEVEGFLTARTGQRGGANMLETLAALNPKKDPAKPMTLASSLTEKNGVTTAGDSEEAMWASVEERIQQIREEMTQWRQWLFGDWNPIREGLWDRWLARVEEMAESQTLLGTDSSKEDASEEV